MLTLISLNFCNTLNTIKWINYDFYHCRNGTQHKTPMKLLNKTPMQQTNLSNISESLILDLNCLLKPINEQYHDLDKNEPAQDTNDDFLVDINDEKILEVQKGPKTKKTKTPQEQDQKIDIKLNDIFVKLENIKPSNHPPLAILEKSGVSITLHLAKDQPKPAVNVYVITTVNKNEFPFSNYLFQAVVPKVSY